MHPQRKGIRTRCAAFEALAVPHFTKQLCNSQGCRIAHESGIPIWEEVIAQAVTKKIGSMNNNTRRDFLKIAAGSAAMAAAGSTSVAAASAEETPVIAYTGEYRAGTAIQDLKAS
ncbi:twin-arginine translocation signal domain-containing protein [Bradyrhizobium sp. 149]|uniref:twin-arginine translocation signal domain-containing protein n=1 Tax=Bradyrhizobium sp. 149 TaxID=2782624 RepID=UPI001FF7C714|nr:twin-arginine translocation signal domain-containing protein [Bradyrhizobium sp. 149]MCK1651576.1 twin-arginine translocation signal domain-containing protein [Bradyrhizobium sp. 149]